MIRRIAILFAVLAGLLLPSAPAWADTGHFHSATSAVVDTGALNVTFDERGLGEADFTTRLCG